jgi:hypothetical protein
MKDFCTQRLKDCTSAGSMSSPTLNSAAEILCCNSSTVYNSLHKFHLNETLLRSKEIGLDLKIMVAKNHPNLYCSEDD